MLLPGCADRKPLIGMLHLLPLPGSPGYGGSLESVRGALFEDVQALQEGGVDGLLLENLGDAPYFPDQVPAATLAHMTALALEVRRSTSLPLGINVLRNDGCAALAVAHATGASFIRVNVLAGARLTDQGIVQGIAHQLLRERARLGAGGVKVFADVAVKHSAPLAERPLEEEVAELCSRAGADAVIVSGATTGGTADPREVERVSRAAGGVPVLVGSGVDADTVGACLPHADGFIVGSALKQNGRAENRVEGERVRRLVARIREGFA